jgi:hypothetical protein
VSTSNYVQQVLAIAVELGYHSELVCFAVEVSREIEGQEAEEGRANTVHGLMQTCALAIAGTCARKVRELTCTGTGLTHIAVAIEGRKDGVEAVQSRRARRGTDEGATMCNSEVNH